MNSKLNLNILLLGESGVGKTTFINALANYLSYKNFYDGTEQPICVLPESLNLFDHDTYEVENVKLGSTSIQDTIESKNKLDQALKCHNFSINDFELNMINTPDIDDDWDEKNVKSLLEFISDYQEINAICVLIKPNNTQVDLIFKNCLLQLLSHLNKSAVDNILFLFTNADTPGNSATILISELSRVRVNTPDIDIKHNKQTIYCVNYEPFTYAVAAASPNNMELTKDVKVDQAIKWKRSYAECKRLLDYITTLSKLIVEGTKKQETPQNDQIKHGDKQKDITLLLLGESGVGKSTFINAFVNYINYETMDEARDGQLKCLLNEKFSLMDPDTYELKTIVLQATNSNKTSNSPKCYKYSTDKVKLDIIDTPDIDETDDVDKSHTNMRNKSGAKRVVNRCIKVTMG
ncbi:unnamed protein product [Oppiella nova]|uniref:G domain-containing protein n=1 Tax=Oppiella nova TaxID=334625 RepID=A0A7R9MJJ4_9ACAR|nr:unnamed protein product [Oppiella nova]CAG2178129.1 unnamed protein product [Oppiella nova]